MSTLVTSTAQIGTIKDAGGNATAMTIDSAGRILRPTSSLVAFDAHPVNAGNVTSGTIPFNTASLNLGNHFNTSSYKFVAPIDGVYEFHARFLCGDAADNNVSSGTINMVLNGSSIISVAHWNSDNAWDNPSIFRIMSMTANQTIEFTVSGAAGGGYVYCGGSDPQPDYNRFIGKLIG